jgi:ligand-binding sensor domain-containing protein
MERTANSELFIFFILLLLVMPVPVTGDNTTVRLNEPAGPDQKVPYTIQLFIPTQRMIHSDQINDLTSGPGGETIIGTSFGLSTYNGTWSTCHTNINNISEGLMDDYITAVERDGDGNLWIGYSSGVQIYNGKTYQSIRDQQVLKETRIKALQRWNNDMWIATGHAGIHRYRDGTWTWFQPMKSNGPGFYEVRSMKLDAIHNTLVIATEVEGLWIMQISEEDKPTFKEIASRYSTYGFLGQVRRDPQGGVYLSNNTMVVHYDPVQGFVPVLTTMDLAPGDISINDVTAAPDNRLFIATNDGIYIWKDGGVSGHLSRYEGLGTSPVIRTVSIDAKNRVWFSSPGYVGYYADQVASTITIEMIEPTMTSPGTQSPVPTPEPSLTTAKPVITPPEQAPFFTEDSILKFLNPIIDPIIKAVRTIGSRG